MILADIELSRKLERTEARANADFVETRARLAPSHGAEWIEVGGAYAMFDGVESPLTQTFGLGVFEDVTDTQLDELESFFKKRGAPVFHEVSPMADQSILGLLAERGYRPIELTSVMCRELDPDLPLEPRTDSRVTARVIDQGEVELWARTSAEAWKTEHPGLGEFMLNFGTVSAQCAGAYPYIGHLDGTAVSTGMLFVYDDICILAGASTVPSGRRQGAQNTLLRARLNCAVQQGCRIAMMCAQPGSQSQKNAQRNGFDIAYTRIKWQLFE
ncbi:MAG: hypothetical protein AB7Q37_12580 [Pyrinomonadaceae bacterium]